MRFPDQKYNLRIQLDTKHFTVSPDEVAKMESALDALSRAVETFPGKDLLITINRHLRNNDYHVKTSLLLPGRTLFTGDRDIVWYAAFERCAGKLVRKVTSYKADLARMPEVSKHEKGTHQEVHPSSEPDAAVLAEAVRAGDYAAFRRATYVYEEPIRKRVGRWVQRYPEVNSQIGNSFPLADIVEEVFLNAFDRYDHWPPAVSLSEWLEHLIDPSVKALIEHPTEEKENIAFARTLTDTP